MLDLSGSEHYHVVEHGGMGGVLIHVGGGDWIYDIMGINGLIHATVESKFDCLILIFPNTDMLINSLMFLFLSPYPASKGNASATKVTWRIQYTSTFAFGMNGGPTRGKWGDGTVASPQMSPLCHTGLMWSHHM